MALKNGKSVARVQRFAANTQGRDFIIGDIHGCFDRVWEAMKTAQFDQRVDRLFSVGDLIDRGPGSHRCVRFLEQPYVFAVRGNHEDELLQLYQDGEPEESVVQFMSQFNGLEWWRDVSKVQRREIIDALQQLPLVIEIETPRGLVGLIHAEVPIAMDWPTFIDGIEKGDKAVVKACLWGRTRSKAGNQSLVAGVDRVFAGHTPQYEGIARYGNLFNLDTGAVYKELARNENGRLTMVNAAMRTESLLRGPSVVQSIDVRDGVVLDVPFGASGLLPAASAS